MPMLKSCVSCVVWSMRVLAKAIIRRLQLYRYTRQISHTSSRMGGPTELNTKFKDETLVKILNKKTAEESVKCSYLLSCPRCDDISEGREGLVDVLSLLECCTSGA
jgi:hypothetical protein